ncbi:hypothetical protein N0V93_004368 [Gnomoniopsis smithogilvyi]|uniref:Uncharacterized protein n=1 Tax=Gnomoniopsis smithogilvyi TaxID=1191159 RepID=A0A9W9CX10_9PEZI|nr:hypothetical protein N0V93_004368 [Gnomoniopsis smithogilvyi]
MLERTAASLEPCHFQRVLPPSKTPFKSSRRLHTAFWQHGAADIELSSVWQALIREPLESFNLFPTSQNSASSRNESLNASHFLLDFLYPQGATSIFRKLSPLILDRYERPRLYLRGTGPRLFTSSASPTQQARLSAEALDKNVSTQEEATSRAVDSLDKIVNETTGLGDGAFVPDEGTRTGGNVHVNGDVRFDALALDSSAQNTANQEGEMFEVGHTGSGVGTVDMEPRSESESQIDISKRESLRDLLNLNDDGRRFERIWSRFHGFDGAEEFRSQFMDYVIRHRSMSYLLARSLQEGHWQTLRQIWMRYPEAYRVDSEPIDWEEFGRHTKLEKMMQKLTSFIKEVQSSEQAAQPAADLDLNKTLLSKFVYPIIHRYHKKLRSSDYVDLPKLLKDPLLYELFLSHTTALSGSRELSDKLYKEYRKVPGVKIRGHVMRAMVHLVYKPVGNAEGMELVLRDLYGRFPRLDMGLYRAYISFYARRGDVKSAQRYFDEYRSHYVEERKATQSPLTRHPDFLDLLHSYALRGELGETRRIFSQAQSDFGPKLNTHCWNVLLNAHAKAGEYDAAVRVFGVLKQAVPADHYSYGTMMGMTGSRGDLEFTLDLYRMAKSEDIQPSVTMVDCVVEAYCQNDKFNDAQNIVKITTERERFDKKELTTLWNSLLWHHALRRDLKTLNETLNQMTEFKIPYDDETYSHLLRALAWCKQPHHALFLLQQAVKTHAFKPTLEHYTLLMSAFIITGQPQELLRTSTILRNLGMPQTGDLLLRVLQALSAQATKTRISQPDQSQKYLLSALRQFRESTERLNKATETSPHRKAKAHKPWIQQSPMPTTVSLRTEHAKILIHTFTLMRQTTDVEGIIELWKQSSPETTNMKEPPLRLLYSLMHAAFYEGKHEEVRRIWRIVFDRAVRMAYVSAPGTTREEPLPAMRYILTDPLKTMQRMHGVTQDPVGLRETVTSVLRAGFRLDSKNWNFYVQLLADLKRWREAFIVCEEQLMPFWRGWARTRVKSKDVPHRIPLDIRRRTMNPHNPRPISYTLMVLSKAYMDLEQMASWSGEAERLLAYIMHKCPVSVSAVRSAVRTNMPLEQTILRQGKPKDSRDKLDTEYQQGVKKPKRRDTTQRRSQQETDMPQSFKEMMEQAVGEETAMYSPQEWDLEDNAQLKYEIEDVPGATVDASATDAEQEDGWYDVNEQDEEDWTPTYTDVSLAELTELRDAEAAIFTRRSAPEASAEAGAGTRESTFSAAQHAFLETHARESRGSRSRSRPSNGKDRSEVATRDAERVSVKHNRGDHSKTGEIKK